jgi:hypothetical protein
MASSGILVTQFDYSKLFIFNNKYRTATYTNSTGGEVTLTKGMLVGRIYSSGKVKQCVSTAEDGSQLPIGVLSANYTVANSASVTVTFCISGEVAREGITFAGSDAYTTLLYMGDDTNSPPSTVKVGVGPLEDWLWGRSIQPVATVENTKADNA